MVANPDDGYARDAWSLARIHPGDRIRCAVRLHDLLAQYVEHPCSQDEKDCFLHRVGSSGHIVSIYPS